MIKNIYLYFLLLLSCTPTNDKNNSTQLKLDEWVDEIKLDSLCIPIKTKSLHVNSVLVDDNIIFLDEFSSDIQFYNLNTATTSIKKIGIGNGPNEIPTPPQKLMLNNNGEYVLYFKDWYIAVFSKDWKERKSLKRLYFPTDSVNYKTAITSPSPNMMSIYTIDYPFNNPQLISNKHLLLAITTEHPKMNAFMHKKYYSDCFTLGMFDVNTGVLEKMSVQRPNKYLNYSYVPNFRGYNYQVLNNGNTLISFEIDERIYTYDKKWKLIKSYGNKGSELKNNYKETHTYEVEAQFHNQRNKYGYYKAFFYDEQDDILLRSYSRGDENVQSGLQIYKEEQLVGDLKVPFNFTIIGKHDNLYYATVPVDESDNEQCITFFTFQL